MEKVLKLEKTKPVCFRGHLHTESESSHSLRQIDTSGRVGLERTVTHKYQFLLKWDIPFFIDRGRGIWMAIFLKTNTPWEESLFDSEILWNWIRQFNPFEKMIHEKGSANLPSGEIYLEIETPGKSHNQGTAWIFKSIPLFW